MAKENEMEGGAEMLSPPKKVKTPKITEDAIASMKRSEIRYALYRCKVKNPEPIHKGIYKYYTDQIEEFGFDISDFAESEGWDVNKADFTEIVTGKTVRKYIKDLLAPSFSVN